MTIVLIVIVVLALWLMMSYNRLVRLRSQSQEAWSDIDVQLKRRYDLIPNLVETVKGYAAHEQGVFSAVTEARTKAMAGGATTEQRAQNENALSGTLKSLFAVAEAYPDLKANQNFLQLQGELSDTENKIQAARRFYNGNVRDLNIAIDTFPTNLFASMLGFAKMTFFELSNEAEKEPVAVKF